MSVNKTIHIHSCMIRLKWTSFNFQQILRSETRCAQYF